MTGPALFLAFGKVSRPLEALAHEGAKVAARGSHLGRQVALIGTGTPAIRLNSPGWLRAPPELIAALPDHAALCLLCRDRLRSITPPFAARASRWIEAYLDQAETDAGPAGSGTEVIHTSDRMFASLLPLPAPRLVPVHLERQKLRPIQGQAVIPLDLAFWDGTRLTAVLFGGENSTPPALRDALAKMTNLLGARFDLQRITTSQQERDLAAKLLMAARAAPRPWFGPYRAEGFHATLPR